MKRSVRILGAMILLLSGCRDTFIGPAPSGATGEGRIFFNALTANSRGTYTEGPVTSIALDGSDRRFIYDVPTLIHSMPRNGKVAYYDPTDWSTDFGRAIVSDFDGSNAKVIAAGVRGVTAIVAPVVLAPNGLTVAYIQRDIASVTNALYVADLDGNVLRRIPIGCSCDIYHLEFSSNGSLIAYVGTDDPRQMIQVVDLASSSTYSIGHNVGSSFTWSPDGTRLAYTQGNNLYYLSYPVLRADSVMMSSTINIIDAGGRHITQILQDDAEVFDLAWSPSGTSIVYARRNDDSPNFHTDLWIINANGSSRRRLTTTSGVANIHPQWTSDGKAIIFTAIPDPGINGAVKNPSVRRFDLITSQSTVLADRAFGGMPE